MKAGVEGGLPRWEPVWAGGKAGECGQDRVVLANSFKAVEGSERLLCWVLDFYLWEMGWEEWLSKYRITAEEL